LNRRATLDSANHRRVSRTHPGHRSVSVLFAHAIDHPLFSGTQNLLRQRGEIPEHPQQICALLDIQLNKSGADRGVYLENARGEFLNPHDLAYLGKMCNTVDAFARRAIIAPQAGQGEENLLVVWTRNTKTSCRDGACPVFLAAGEPRLYH